MDFSATQYYQASLRRLEESLALYRSENFALSTYCAGVSVECMFRAYRWRYEPSFDGRHDLLLLFKASRLQRISEDNLREKGRPEEEVGVSAVRLRNSVQELLAIWHNNLRYSSEARFRSHLNDLGRVQGVRGDPSKKNANDAWNAADHVIAIGTSLWS